jgi:hypothetical protein
VNGIELASIFQEGSMSRTRLAILALALVSPVATAAMADTVQVSTASVTPRVGDTLRDVAGRRIGNVESVRADQGVVTVIIDMRLFRIPISTLSAGEKGLQTSLKRTDLR